MKIITLEEHFLDPDMYAGLGAPPGIGAPAGSDLPEELLKDLGEGRVADMTNNNIAMQVLSSLSTQLLPADVAADRVRTANDKLAATVREHPDRFAGFAALPTAVPKAAADELDRAVTDLGFVGTMVMGRPEGQFLSAPRFEPILARAAALGVPIYLHPGPPPRATREENYSGFAPAVSTAFQTFAWGWHVETAVHFINIVLSGVFDRYPRLQFILGHWGEMIPFYLERLDWALPRSATKLDRTISEYMRENVYVTPSGLFTQANLQYCVELLGVDRILYSVDYPFVGNAGAESFLEDATLTAEDKEKIAHGTAERLLGL